jgi:hypothetical protein
VKAASAEGFLKERVAKQFLYFEDKKRDEDSEKHPKLVRVLAHSGQVPYAIERELDQIASAIREQFSSLIIVPTKNQCRSVVRGLLRRGFRNVSFVDREEKIEPDLLDGMMLLLGDKDSNLGWRIIPLFPTRTAQGIFPGPRRVQGSRVTKRVFSLTSIPSLLAFSKIRYSACPPSPFSPRWARSSIFPSSSVIIAPTKG